MDDEAEPSGATQRQGESSAEHADPEDAVADVDEEEELRLKKQSAKERSLDAKRKRIRMLNDLLRELDLIVYMELITVYYLEYGSSLPPTMTAHTDTGYPSCSFFWLAVKALIHASLLTPTADALGERPPAEPKPFFPLILFSLVVNPLLHQLYPAPSAGEDTRGYLHGGWIIDFVGQQGPTSKWKLGALDLCILLLQLVMVAVHAKRRELKRKLAKLATGTPSSADRATADAAGDDAAQETANENAAREQDADDEERGVLHRTDTLSDVGADPDEEDALLSSLDTSDTGHSDALELLTSGQCVIGDFTLIDTLLQENKKYAAYRLTRTESGMGDMPEALRRINTLRTRFGAGGG
jgi:hypothetical protein